MKPSKTFNIPVPVAKFNLEAFKILEGWKKEPESNQIGLSVTACCYCVRQFKKPLKRTVEHIVPVSKGGYNNRFNKIYCCFDCNGWRANKELSEFKNEIVNLLAKNRTIHFKTYTRIDLQCMVENIEKLQVYVSENGGAMGNQLQNDKQ